MCSVYMFNRVFCVCAWVFIWKDGCCIVVFLYVWCWCMKRYVWWNKELKLVYITHQTIILQIYSFLGEDWNDKKRTWWWRWRRLLFRWIMSIVRLYRKSIRIVPAWQCVHITLSIWVLSKFVYYNIFLFKQIYQISRLFFLILLYVSRRCIYHSLNQVHVTTFYYMLSLFFHFSCFLHCCDLMSF